MNRVNANLHRRAVLTGIGLTGLSACATAPGRMSDGFGQLRFERKTFAPLVTDPGRITRITVCTRPFRPQGPRIEVEVLGDKRLVHNYGHGGSGWSLSWGSGALARDLALAEGPRPTAVIGCGALGLTAALQILRSGVPTTIYAAERAPYTRSVRATGVWSPDSRVADARTIDPGFATRWEALSRNSWATHHSFLGMDGDPVRFIDQYNLRDAEGQGEAIGPAPSPGDVRFAKFSDRLGDLGPRGRSLSPDDHPFPVPRARVFPNMTFNVAEYARQMTEAFLLEGGRIETRVFNHPSELASLEQPVVVNCTGYGARALFGDDSLVPVRGQIGWLAPQPDVTYAINYNAISMVPRHDGIVIQANGPNEMVGYGIEDETPDRSETEEALAMLATLFPGPAAR